MNCPLDQTEMTHAFEAEVLGKYQCSYQWCRTCGLVKPSNVTWLEEAYSSAIAKSDIGIIQRNRVNLVLLESILFFLTGKGDRILDVGGGYGIMCRGLRDQGFDCFTTDSYCENLFARGFEPGEGFKAKALLAFEVYEHIDDPLDFTRGLIRKYGADTIVFSTLAYSGDNPPPKTWWYWTFETGQHISIYHLNSLKALAANLGWHYCCLRGIHVLSAKKVPFYIRLILHPGRKIIGRVAGLFVKLIRWRKSFLTTDYEQVRNSIMQSGRTEVKPANKD